MGEPMNAAWNRDRSCGGKPIEVVLTRKNIEVTCLVAFEDETTGTLGVDSLSMRGAQREITGYLIGEGFEPADRWQTEEASKDGDTVYESSRTFRPPKTRTE